MKFIKSLLFCVVMIFSPLLQAEVSPVPMLENRANQILSSLEENKSQLKNDHAIVYRAVRAHLVPIVDVNGMSRSVLGRQVWNKATAQQKSKFNQEFTNLVIRTYATPLSEYTNEKIKFLPVRGGVNGKFVRVNSVIVRTSGKNIPLSYSLVSKNGQWKIYDLSVEGVSLLQSFRSQFGQLLQNDNLDTLIQQMQKKSA